MSDGAVDWERFSTGAMAADELAAASRRLVADPAYAAAWLRAARFEGDLAALVRSRAQRAEHGHPSVRRPVLRRRAPSARRRWLPAAVLAAVAVLALAIGLLAWPEAPAARVHGPLVVSGGLAPGARLHAEGASAALLLADGSRLDFTSGATAEVAALDAGCDLVLGAGTIDAVIAAQAPGHRVRIRTHEAAVTVVGTRFTVQRGAEGTVVRVVEGVVEVAAAGRPTRRLAAGGQVAIPAAGAWFGADLEHLDGPPDRPWPLLRWAHRAWQEEQCAAPTATDPGRWVLPNSRHDLATVAAWAQVAGSDLWLVLPLAWDDAVIDRMADWLAAHPPGGRILVQLGHEPWNPGVPDGRVAQAAADGALGGRVAVTRLQAALPRWRARGLQVEGVASLPPETTAVLFAPAIAGGLTGIAHLAVRPGPVLNLLEVPADGVDDVILRRAAAADEVGSTLAWARAQGLDPLGFDVEPAVWTGAQASPRDRERVEAFLRGPWSGLQRQALQVWRSAGGGAVTGSSAVAP